MINQAIGRLYPQPDEESQAITTIKRLYYNKKTLTERLDKIDKAIDLLNSNPQLAELLNAIEEANF